MHDIKFHNRLTLKPQPETQAWKHSCMHKTRYSTWYKWKMQAVKSQQNWLLCHVICSLEMAVTSESKDTHPSTRCQKNLLNFIIWSWKVANNLYGHAQKRVQFVQLQSNTDISFPWWMKTKNPFVMYEKLWKEY